MRSFAQSISIEHSVRLRSFNSALLIAALLQAYSSAAICGMKCSTWPIFESKAVGVSLMKHTHAAAEHQHASSEPHRGSATSQIEQSRETLSFVADCCNHGQRTITSCSSSPEAAVQGPVERPSLDSSVCKSQASRPVVDCRNSSLRITPHSPPLSTPSSLSLRI